MIAAIHQWVVGATLLSGLGTVFVVILRRARYTFPIALVVSTLALVQPAFCNLTTILNAAVFAAVVCAVAITAMSLVEQQDVRRIALLGGSLAGAQLVHPLWGAAATIMLPFALRNKLDAESAAGVTGLYISILFIPVVTATALFSFDVSFRSEILSLAKLHSMAHFGLRRILNSIAAVLISAAPVLFGVAVQPKHQSARVIGAIAVALMAACIALDSFVSQFAILTVGFGALAIPLFGGWKFSGRRAHWVVGLSLANIVAAWASHYLVQANA
jgi:hypothetical protein